MGSETRLRQTQYTLHCPIESETTVEWNRCDEAPPPCPACDDLHPFAESGEGRYPHPQAHRFGAVSFRNPLQHPAEPITRHGCGRAGQLSLGGFWAAWWRRPAQEIDPGGKKGSISLCSNRRQGVRDRSAAADRWRVPDDSTGRSPATEPSYQARAGIPSPACSAERTQQPLSTTNPALTGPHEIARSSCSSFPQQKSV